MLTTIRHIDWDHFPQIEILEILEIENQVEDELQAVSERDTLNKEKEIVCLTKMDLLQV